MDARAIQSSPAAEARRQQLSRHAQRLVGQVFFGTILKQMRESRMASPLFSGGRGGQAFTAIYDQHLAERMSRGAGRRLAESIVRRLDGAAERQAGARNVYCGRSVENGP